MGKLVWGRGPRPSKSSKARQLPSNPFKNCHLIKAKDLLFPADGRTPNTSFPHERDTAIMNLVSKLI
jgi:hypothetical protein